MKKKSQKDYIDFIRKTVDHYAPYLLLDNHIIVVRKEEEGEYLACRFRYPYLDGQVIYSDRSYQDWLKEPETYHKRKILHELCHLLTDPLYGKATTMWTSRSEIEDERERLTDNIAVIVLKLLKEEID